MDLFALIKLSHEKNAVNRFVWMRRLTYFSLVGGVRMTLEVLTEPSWFMLKILTLLWGGATGAMVRPGKEVRDPSLEAALGNVFCLLGLLALWGKSLWIPYSGLFLLGFGIFKAFLAVKELSHRLDAIFSFLLKAKCIGTKGYFFNLCGTIDLALGGIYFTFAPSWQSAFALFLSAAFSALRFPLSRMHMDRLPKPGTALSGAPEKQMTELITCEKKRRHLLFVIRRLLRLTLRGKVEGSHNMPLENQKGVICLCNHGYVQGTIFSRIWFDRPFRSWSLSDLMEPEDAYVHIRKYQVDEWAWVPISLRDPLTKLLIRLFAWLFDSLDNIPVYRNHLRKLMNTFRMTVDAMECGDLVTIYPENPDDPSLEKPGYLSEGIGPFFSGFTMIGSLYHSRTGQPVTYVPMYCSKKKRKLCIGEPIVYNPDNDSVAEKERIVTTVRQAMLDLMTKVETPTANLAASV